MKKLWFVAAVLMACGVARGGTAGVVYVDDDAKAGGDGTSWSTAFRSLQDALAAVRASGAAAEVRVAQGVYRPDDGAGLTAGDRELSFALDVAVTVRGGYAGIGAVDPDARDVKGFVTTLSGDLAGDDAPGFVNRSENTKRVVVMSAASGEAALEGVVVRGGENDDRLTTTPTPGGILVTSGVVKVRDCLVTDNRGWLGGGIGLGEVDMEMERVWIRSNYAGYAGGGLATLPLVHGDESNVRVSACRFSLNEAPQVGGALVQGIYTRGFFVNCLIDRNRAHSDSGWSVGGGLAINTTYVKLIHSVVYENDAREGESGGLLDFALGSASYNCIFWNNRAVNGTHFYSNLGGNASLATSYTINLVQEFAASTTATVSYYLTSDPQFVDPDGADNIPGNEDDDFHLRATSPCIDAGMVRPSFPTYPAPGSTVDADGLPRVVDDPTRPNTPLYPSSAAPVDLGMYEYQEDCDGNGVVDSVDLLAAPSLDCDHNGIIDSCEFVDCNANAINDRCEVGEDCNANGVLDSCEIALNAGLDADSNGVLDACEFRVIRVAAPTALAGKVGAWTDGFESLQDALVMAAGRVAASEIWVVGGRYTPDGPGGRRNSSFVIPPNTVVYGGFAGTETAREQRDPESNPTVLSGDLNGDDLAETVLGEATTPPDRDDNSVAVMLIPEEGDGVEVHDLIIEGGQADGPPNVGPIRYAQTNAGTRTYGAGLMAGIDPYIVVTGCEFRRNMAMDSSAGADADGHFLNCRFVGNVARSTAGALSGSGVLVEACTFEQNRTILSGSRGGGAFHQLFPWLNRVNSFERCRFIGNVSGGPGGALSFPASQAVQVTNCFFSGNVAATDGGGVYVFTPTSSTPTAERGVQIRGSTFVGNQANHAAGLFVQSAGNASFAVIANNIFWGNIANSAVLSERQVRVPSGLAGFVRNVIQDYGGTQVDANFGLDPKFVDVDGTDNALGTSDDDARVAAGSPCIDAGNNWISQPFYGDPVPTDLLGRSRYIDNPATIDTGSGFAPIIDIGAVEFAPPACLGDVNGDGRADGRDLSVFLAAFGLQVAPGTGADVNGDGLVDGRDLSVFLANFGCGG